MTTTKTPTTLTKSFNRSSDVLPNTPLRHGDWLKTFKTTDELGKRALAETWLERLFQHTKGMAQKEFDSFMGKLWGKQFDWFAVLPTVIDDAFFATHDMTPHANNLYAVLWDKHTPSEEVLWLRELLCGSEQQQLAALSRWTQMIDPLVCARYGNLLPVLSERISELPGATDEHRTGAITINLLAGEQGVRRENGMPQTLAHWQDFGYFGSFVFYHVGATRPTRTLADAVKRTVTTMHIEMFLSRVMCYLDNAMYKGAGEVDYIRKDSLLGLGSSVYINPRPYEVLSAWLPQYAPYFESCAALDTPVWTACKALKTQLKGVAPVELPAIMTQP